MRLLDTLRYALDITSSYSKNYNIKQFLIPGLPDIANLSAPGFVKRNAGTTSICMTLASFPLNSDNVQPYMNRIIRRRYQLSSIPFFYPEDGNIIFLLNAGKFLRYIPEDSLLYPVLFCLQMGLPPTELSVPIQGTSIFPLRVKNESLEVIQSVSRDNPYPTAFPYGNVMVLHFYQQQESSTTKTVHKVINKGLKTYV